MNFIIDPFTNPSAWANAETIAPAERVQLVDALRAKLAAIGDDAKVDCRAPLDPSLPPLLIDIERPLHKSLFGRECPSQVTISISNRPEMIDRERATGHHAYLPHQLLALSADAVSALVAELDATKARHVAQRTQPRAKNEQERQQERIEAELPRAEVDAWICANMGYTAERLAEIKTKRRKLRREARNRMLAERRAG